MALTVSQQLTCGAIAGVFYWIFTFPTDVIKSSMQSDHIDKTKRQHKNILQCAITLHRDEGGWRDFTVVMCLVLCGQSQQVLVCCLFWKCAGSSSIKQDINNILYQKKNK